MDQILKEIQTLIINAKKSRGRKYTQETIREKYNFIHQLSKKFGKLVGHLPETLREKKIKEFKILKITAIELLEEHSNIPNTSPNMSDFDSKKASDTIPTFDGKPTHLDIFLSMVEMVYNDLNEQGKPKLIKYVTAIKLSDKVRNILMTQNIPSTFSELKISLSTNFKPTKTASCLHSEIRNTRQKGTVSGYRDKINTLIAELTVIQFTDLGENSNDIARSTIRMMNEKLALETFQEGLQENIRTAVVAAQPKTLAQAYEVASTQERLLEATGTLKILHINDKRRQNNNYGNIRNRNYENNRYNNTRKQNLNTNQNRYNRNYNYNNNNNSNRNYTNYGRNPSNGNNHNNAFNRSNRNLNYTNQRHNSQNVRTIHQQGNGETLETQYESPRREN